MKFVLDESTDFRLRPWLLSLGHEVATVTHNFSASLDDRAVLENAVRHKYILITNDADFGELVVRRAISHSGVILLRLSDESLDWKLLRLAEVLDQFSEELSTHLCVVTDRHVRLRIA